MKLLEILTVKRMHKKIKKGRLFYLFLRLPYILLYLTPGIALIELQAREYRQAEASQGKHEEYTRNITLERDERAGQLWKDMGLSQKIVDQFLRKANFSSQGKAPLNLMGNREKKEEGSYQDQSSGQKGKKNKLPQKSSHNGLNQRRLQFLKDCPNSLRGMDRVSLEELRFAERKEDFFLQVWREKGNCLRESLALIKDEMVAFEVLTFLIKRKSRGLQPYMQGLEKSGLFVDYPAFLSWSKQEIEKIEFYYNLKQDKNFLIKMSYSEFWRKNGREYPTVLHQLGYLSATRLMLGLKNPDVRLKRDFLRMLRYLKTSYNSPFIRQSLREELLKKENQFLEAEVKALLSFYNKKQ